MPTIDLSREEPLTHAPEPPAAPPPEPPPRPAPAEPTPRPVPPTTPEPAPDIAAQVAALLDPNNPKHTIFIAAGSPVPENLPPDIIVAVRPQGTLLTVKPGYAGRFSTATPLTDELIARLLGYPETKADAVASGNPQVVQGVDPAGHVVAETLVSPDNVKVMPSGKENVQRSHARGWVIALVILLGICALIYSCISRDAEEKARKDAVFAEQRRKEIAAFSTSEIARTTIGQRLASRLVRDGSTLVTNSDDVLHTISVLPVGIPWVVSCDKLGLSVQLGANSTDPNSSDAVFIPIIPIDRADFLSVEKCKEIAPILGDAMNAMTDLPPRSR